MDGQTVAVLVVIALVIGFFVWKSKRGSGKTGTSRSSKSGDGKQKRR